MKKQQPNNTKYLSGLERPANSSGNNPIQQKTINNRFANFNTVYKWKLPYILYAPQKFFNFLSNLKNVNSIFIFGYNTNDGLGSKKSIKFYDKYIFPISKILDKLGFKHFIGKNLLIIAKKN